MKAKESPGISAGITRFLEDHPDTLDIALKMPSSDLNDLWQRGAFIYDAMDASYWLDNQGIGQHTFARIANDVLSRMKLERNTDEAN